MVKFYDIHLHPKIDNAEEIIKIAEKLGWHGICLVEYFNNSNSFKKFSENISNLKKDTNIEIFTGAKIKANNRNEIAKLARKAMNCADLIFGYGNFNVNREFAECFEMDILSHPERNIPNDFMDQKNSGIDHIIAKLLAEHKTAIEINFSDILNVYGLLRAQVMGRITQNIKLARKYNCLSILTSGADNMWGMRAPGEFVAVGKALGMTESDAKNSVSRNPEMLIQKSLDRKDPCVILDGVQVLEWGDQKPEGKKMFGWY
ncbi:MAG: hypothetical protein CVT90_00895 [Candidatus Altiarchaeales archaeon HGW-Altiarchaeales-3]|nr:MAG: hypothetical protein CVT90_00895 [Candidatus Altiarchaeales archaeon HGW-Altiarchaeales-3]